MAQTTTSRTPAKGYPGKPVDGTNCEWISRAAAEAIEFGDWLVETSDGKKVRKPLDNVYTITLDGDFVASNSITGTLQYRQLDDTAFTEVTIGPVVYAASHNNTMDLLVTELEAELATPLGSAGTVELTDASNNRQITITLAEGYEVKGGTALAITLGSGQAGVTEARSSADSVMGLAVHQDVEPTTISNNSANYAKNASVRVGVKGTYYQTAEDAFTTASSLYARRSTATGKARGDLRTSATDAIAVSGAKIRNSGSASDLAEVAINFPG